MAGAAPGTVTITATQGDLSGSAVLSVCPNLAVGETYTATFPGAADVCFAGGGAGAAEHTYVPVNLSSSSSLSLTLTGSGIVAVTGPPTPGPVASALELSPQEKLARDERRHAEMLAAAAHIARTLAGSGRITSLKGTMAGGIPTGVPAVGDLWSLSVALGCAGAPNVRAGRVVSVSTRAIVVADTTNPVGGFTTAQYDSIGLEFDSIAYPTLVNNFGAPTDLDGNGRVVIFYTRAVNELSPPASSVVVQGFSTARDLFSAAPGSCPLSNEGEMFYMLVPDPTGAVNSNVRTVSFVRGNTVGTTGHEFQHLINASRRLYVVGTTDLEDVWLNEGMSHIGEELMFYSTSFGLAPRGNINLSSLTTGPNASRRVAAFNTYANQNYGRMRSWMQRPDTTGPLKNVDALASRGAAWGFLRYAADRGNGNDATFWSSLISASTGKANLQNAIGADPDEWARDFLAAMYADDAVAGIESQYTQPSWNFRSVYGGLGGFPLGTRTLSNGVGLTLSYSRGAGSAYARFGVPQSGFATVSALSGGVIPVSPYSTLPS